MTWVLMIKVSFTWAASCNFSSFSGTSKEHARVLGSNCSKIEGGKLELRLPASCDFMYCLSLGGPQKICHQVALYSFSCSKFYPWLPVRGMLQVMLQVGMVSFLRQNLHTTFFPRLVGKSYAPSWNCRFLFLPSGGPQKLCSK